MDKQLIKLGHSPDPDDAFMFYGLARDEVDSGPFEFKHILNDIQTLNEWAQQGRLEVTAISVHAYAYVQDKYAILSSGASMGATELADYEPGEGEGECSFAKSTPPTNVHGPLLVAGKEIPREQLTRKTIAVPGTMTSAFLTLRLAVGEFDYVVMPFDTILEAVQKGQVDAGLIIHEGQLTYKDMGLCSLMDLGKWWYEQTALPMPLGCNVIRRDLGKEKMARISAILKSSIAYGLAHRGQAVEYALGYGRGLDRQMADQFVGMYVNQWTLDYGPVGRQAVTELLKRGSDAKIIPPVTEPEFV